MSNSLKTKLNLNSLSDKQLKDLAASLEVLEDRKKYCKQEFAFPAYTKNAGYRKHLIFIKAGKEYKERALIAGNRTGKTYTADLEVSFHLNGKYPDGWEGRTFDFPIRAWIVGKTNLTTRDILQKYMLGPRYDLGSGFLPKEDIYWDEKFHVTTKPGTPDAIQDVYIKHYTNGQFDGYSELSFKSYDQGVEAFMGTAQHVIHLDEEPTTPGIYSECLLRTMTTDGIIICTFTPLAGLSDVVLSFLPNGMFPPGGIGCVDSKPTDSRDV